MQVRGAVLRGVHQPWEIGNRFADAGAQPFGTQSDAACEATA